MKIKRFEAENMSEALRKIKREFGEEAVILSAKTVKKGKRLLGKKDAQRVVVTAAVDKMMAPNPTDPGMDTLESKSAIDSSDPAKTQGAFYNGSNILKKFKPITKTGQKILKPKFVRLMSESQAEHKLLSYTQRLMDAGLNPDTAADWGEQLRGLLSNENCITSEVQHALAQIVQARGIVGNQLSSLTGKQKCIVLLGPAGSGKTSVAVKMAAKYAIQQENAVAMISLDNQRVAGAIELERYANIIGGPFKTAFNPDELKDRLSCLKPFPLLLIDTPALAPNDRTSFEKLIALTNILEDADKILMVNAALEASAMSKIVDSFLPFNLNCLCFSHLDWADKMGTMINLSEKYKLPIGYISKNANVSEGLLTAKADLLAQLLISGSICGDGEVDDRISVIMKRDQKNEPYYVANRNSDIFHFHTCKSVERINTDNIIDFKDPAEAIGQNFKPCRMCCGELIVQKPLDRQARGYAGNRY